MKLLRIPSNLTLNLEPSIVTIGNFDGIHLGHQKMLKRCRELSLFHKAPSVVILFEPSPAEYFNPAASPVRLSTLRDKLSLIEKMNIDKVICLRFNEHLSQLSAESFIEDILINNCNVQSLVVGQDFEFGHKRMGNCTLLQQAAEQFKFSLEIMQDYCISNQRVSSTLVRQKLAENDFHAVRTLLGREYSMTGRVIHGEKRGKIFGIPTANINPKRLHSPLSGIFFVVVDAIEKNMPGVAHIGKQPAVGGTQERLEVHLLDFTGNLYGETLTVKFLAKHREVESFKSIDELIVAMNHDVLMAKAFFKKPHVG